jgi:hypothetical protein
MGVPGDVIRRVTAVAFDDFRQFVRVQFSTLPVNTIVESASSASLSAAFAPVRRHGRGAVR